MLSDKINGNISVGKISYALFNRLIVKDVLVTGSVNDTIIHAKKISINLHARTLISGDMKARKIAVDGAQFNICKVTPEESNLAMLLKRDTTQQVAVLAETTKKV